MCKSQAQKTTQLPKVTVTKKASSPLPKLSLSMRPSNHCKTVSHLFAFPPESLLYSIDQEPGLPSNANNDFMTPSTYHHQGQHMTSPPPLQRPLGERSSTNLVEFSSANIPERLIFPDF
jgi:hypothetical protein